MANKNNIECMWQKDSKFLVNPDKQVWPCCYLGNQGYFMKAIAAHRDSDMLAKGVDDVVHPVMQEYYDHEDELNLANESLEDILNHKWYTETLPKSWDADKPVRLCMIMCSRNLDDTP
jgi:hypothetical protein